jgi:hypothetical protein
MSTGLVLAAKAALGAALTVLAVLVARGSWVDALAPARATSWFLGALLASRLGLFVALFGLAGVPVTSDVTGHYYPQAVAVLAGQVPYRDFPSSYGVAFPYLAALPLRLWNAPESLVLLAIALELVAAPVWLAIARDMGGEAVARRAALLYVLSPVPLVNVAVNGQNQVWVATGLALAIRALLGRRDVLSGLVLGGVAGGVKFLALLFAPALALTARRPVAWSVACAAAPLALLVLGRLGSLDVLLPVRLEAPLYSSGNLPFLLGLLGVDLDAVAVQAAMLAALCAVLGATAAGARFHREGDDRLWTAHAIALLLLTFLLVSRKSFTSYLVMAFFPLCLSVAAGGLGGRTVALFGALGTIAVVEPSAWFRWLDARGLWELGDAVPPGGRAGLTAFVVLDVGLLAGYVWLVARTWRALRRRSELVPQPAGARAW